MDGVAGGAERTAGTAEAAGDLRIFDVFERIDKFSVKCVLIRSLVMVII